MKAINQQTYVQDLLLKSLNGVIGALNLFDGINSCSEYIADPAHPVPYTEDVHFPPSGFRLLTA